MPACFNMAPSWPAPKTQIGLLIIDYLHKKFNEWGRLKYYAFLAPLFSKEGLGEI
jgi:hypothetical protein